MSAKWDPSPFPGVSTTRGAWDPPLRCSALFCEATAARPGEPLPASERGGREARASRLLGPQGHGLPTSAGPDSYGPARRRAPTRARPPPHSARGPSPAQGTLPRPPQPSPVQDGGGLRSGVGAGPRALGPPGLRRVADRAPRGTPGLSYLPACSREPAAPRIGRGRGGDSGAGPTGAGRCAGFIARPSRDR